MAQLTIWSSRCITTTKARTPGKNNWLVYFFMCELNTEVIAQYLRSLHDKQVQVLRITPLGEDGGDKRTKSWGYGSPVRIDYQVENRLRSLVLHTIRPGPFGHEHMADRAQALLWSNQAFRSLPHHVRAFDVGGFRSDGTLMSAGDITEFFLLTEYAEGQGYVQDLNHLQQTEVLEQLDLDRADTLCDYLVKIHRKRDDNPGLYTRRIRELIGHGECIMGIVDHYGTHPSITDQKLQQIELACVDWRWRLKGLTHRLKEVHGDFHPWNILFRSGTDFTVLDRSRGEYGDPADDVASITMNYLFFSLQYKERLTGVFETLFLRFWDRYLEKTGDMEMLRVVAPFLVFRGLVMASPLWYPNLPDIVRLKLFTFIFTVLKENVFDPARVNQYCDA